VRDFSAAFVDLADGFRCRTPVLCATPSSTDNLQVLVDG